MASGWMPYAVRLASSSHRWAAGCQGQSSLCGSRCMHWLLRLIGFYQPVRILRQPKQSRLFKGGGTRCVWVDPWNQAATMTATPASAFPPIFYQSEDSAAAAVGAADLPIPKSSAALGLEPPRGWPFLSNKMLFRPNDTPLLPAWL